MPRQKKGTPQASAVEDFLTSSDSLPEFSEVEAELATLQTPPETPETEVEDKPKRGRKKKNPEPLNFEPETIEDIACIPLDMLFERQGKEKLNRLERKQWSKAVSGLMNKYLPAALNDYNVEITAALALGMILLPRLSAKKPEEIEPPSEPIPEVTT